MTNVEGHSPNMLRGETAPGAYVTADSAWSRLTVRPGRRRWAAATAGSAVIAAGVVAGVAVGQAASGAGSDPSVTRASTFSPESLEAALDRAVSAAQSASSRQTVWRRQEVVAETGATAQRLTGPDRAKADRWQARYADGADHLVDIVLIYESPVSLADLVADCATTVTAGHADACEPSRTDTGALTQSIERTAYQMGEAWPYVDDALLAAPIPPEKQWYLHQVKVFNPDGLTVVATEVARTPSPLEAASQWTLSPDALRRLAADPQLTFPRQ